MSISFTDNAKFLKHLKKSTEDAYIYLVKTYHKTLLTYALSLSNNYPVAEDIVQNVYLKIWRYRDRLKKIDNIKSFLYKSTYNEFINQYKKNKTISSLEYMYMDTLRQIVEEDQSEIFDKKITLIKEGIKTLPKKCKEIFLLSKTEGLTNTEIANYLNISIKTVEGQLTKAYRVLRELGNQNT